MQHLRMKLVHVAVILCLALSLFGRAAQVQAANDARVTLIHFSDYHSHAVPFYSEGKANQAGLARTIAYLKQMKAANPNVLVLSGGDTMNSGTPAWSDKYQCAEWAMFNGLVDAMAIGNHEFDYGWDAFLKCRDTAKYPLVSANFVYSDTNQPVVKPWLVQEVGGVKLGLFALAGPDFSRLVTRKNLADNVAFADNLAAAKQAVAALRGAGANAIIFFGHEDREADFEMAKQVPGIDLILGTHSHFKGDLQKIQGTNTWFISPFQYLTYLSQVELTFSDGKLANVTGKLVKMDESVKADADADAKVSQMQKDLESDPKYAEKFTTIGQAAKELSVDGIDKRETLLGDFVMDTLRRVAQAQTAFSTASSFRASIAPGKITLEDYLTALPYKNVMLVYELTGAQLMELLNFSASKLGSDNFSVTSGVRYQLADGKVSNVQVLKGSSDSAGYAPLDMNQKYTVLTTDFQAKIASGYKDIFGKATLVKDTGLIVNDTLIDYIKRNSPISAQLDNRLTVQTAGAPPQLPQTGAAQAEGDWLWYGGLGMAAFVVGWLLRRSRNA